MANMTDWFPRNPATTMFRSFFALLDGIVYTLMSFLYHAPSFIPPEKIWVGGHT